MLFPSWSRADKYCSGSLGTTTSNAYALPWRQIVTITWIGIAGFLALRFGRAVHRLRRVVSSCNAASAGLSRQVHSVSQRCGLKRPLQVLLSEPGSIPMACWLGRWTIVVPEDLESWSEDLQEVTLLHELGHIARRDAWIDFLAQCVACVLWPNPFVWMAAADTRRLRERACDEWSLARYGGDAKRYAVSLVEIVRRCQQQEFQVACAMADKRGLEARLKWLFSCPTSRRYWRCLSLPIALVALGLAVAVGTAKPATAPPGDGKQDSTPASTEWPSTDVASAEELMEALSPRPEDSEEDQQKRFFLIHLLTVGGTIIVDPTVLSETADDALVLGGSQITDDTLQRLASHTGLRSLSMFATNVTGTGLQYLTNLDQLETLVMAGPHVTDAWLANVPALHGVKRLLIPQTRVTNAGLQQLEKFTQLQELDLRYSSIDGEGLRVLEHISQVP